LIARIAIVVMAASVLMPLSLFEAAAAGSQGLLIQKRYQNSKEPQDMYLYQSSRALVIRIDAYTADWPRLDMTVAIARAIAQELEDRGLETKTNAFPTPKETRMGTEAVVR
jgi:hypothetical protein